MADTNFTSVDTSEGYKVNGTTVIDSTGAVIADIQATAGSIGTAELATNAITTVKITDANVTLAKLAAGITPSHVVKYAGTSTWSGSGATKAQTVTGVAATDIVTATVLTKATEASYLVAAVPTTNTITFELSAANTSNDAVIQYVVHRAAA
jgi:hypothetical protein